MGQITLCHKTSPVCLYERLNTCWISCQVSLVASSTLPREGLVEVQASDHGSTRTGTSGVTDDEDRLIVPLPNVSDRTLRKVLQYCAQQYETEAISKHAAAVSRQRAEWEAGYMQVSFFLPSICNGFLLSVAWTGHDACLLRCRLGWMSFTI